MSAAFPREVETERLLLRQFREQDLEAYLRMVSNPEVLRHIGDGEAPTREQAWRHMAMLAGAWTILGYGPWAIEVKATGELVGRVGVWCPEGWPEMEAGWVIAAEHWGRGYATEAGAEALRQAFGSLGVDHMISMIRPDNVASRRVAEKLGGRIERTEAFRGQRTLFYGYTSPPPDPE